MSACWPRSMIYPSSPWTGCAAAATPSTGKKSSAPHTRPGPPSDTIRHPSPPAAAEGSKTSMSVDLEEFGDPLLWRALMSENTTALPVVVVGAGPIGLAAAAHLIGRGLEPLVVEAGPSAGTAVREWAHVRLFSPWAPGVDPAAQKRLAPTGWVKPDGGAEPSGASGSS